MTVSLEESELPFPTDRTRYRCGHAFDRRKLSYLLHADRCTGTLGHLDHLALLKTSAGLVMLNQPYSPEAAWSQDYADGFQLQFVDLGEFGGIYPGLFAPQGVDLAEVVRTLQVSFARKLAAS